MMGAFNQDAVEKLTFISEMSKNINLANGMSGNNCFDFVLPGFVLCLRDFFLEPESSDGRKITPDEYLEDCLKSKEVKTKEDEKYNRPRESIRQYFPRRRVFTLDRPGGKKVMTRLDSVHDDELSEDFVEDTVKFTSYIFQCEPKMLLNRQLVSGSMLAKLARAYVKSMREGGVPCVEDAMTTMARKENENMVKKAVSEFEKKMGDVQLPIHKRTKLLEFNFSIQKSILTTLVKDLVYDDNDEAMTSAEKQMNDIALMFIQTNDEQLRKICMEKLEDYYKPIAEKISNNKYNVSGGYRIYKKDMSELEKKYFKELQHVEDLVRTEVLESFLDNKREDEKKILENDQLLTEKEKEEELRKREEMRDQKLKESQDLMLKELEKQKLDHEEKMRRITEEQRQKEEANTRMHMNAILQAGNRDQTFIEEMRRQHERIYAENRRGILARAVDFFLGF